MKSNKEKKLEVSFSIKEKLFPQSVFLHEKLSARQIEKNDFDGRRKNTLLVFDISFVFLLAIAIKKKKN